MRLIVETCDSNKTIIDCLDRETQKSPFKDLPYDDVSESQLPKNRSERNKWRGKKGGGIWVDSSLVTKSEKIQELERKLDEELDKENSDAIRVAKLQRLIKKAQEAKDEFGLLKPEQLAQLDESKIEKKSFVANAISTVGEFFGSILEGIKNGFLALKSLVTEKVQIGSAEQPGGITVFDQVTKQPHCLVVASGQVQSLPGECGAVANSNADSSPPPAAQNDPNADTQSPVITILGNNPAQIEKGSVYTDMGATVTDNVNPNLGLQVSGADFDTSVVGSYMITYTATDQAGNTATTTREVIVFVPSVPEPISEPDLLPQSEPQPEPTTEPLAEPAPSL